MPVRCARSLILAVLLLGGAGCTYAPRYDDGPYAYDYYYYPHVGVYFHLFSGHYYYRDHDRWLRVRALPPHIVLDHRVRRSLVIRDPQPYRHHEQHRAQYRAPPAFRHEPRYDRPEREHNRRLHEEYRKRWDHQRRDRR